MNKLFQRARNDIHHNEPKETVALGDRSEILFTDLEDKVMQTLAKAFKIDVNLIENGGILQYTTIDWEKTTARSFVELKKVYTKFNPVLVDLFSNQDSAPGHYALIDLETGNLISEISSDIEDILESSLEILIALRNAFIRYYMAVN